MKFKKPWSYDPINRNYTINATFWHVQSFLTVAFFLALVGISFFNGG